jgi:hypothetical protein
LANVIELAISDGTDAVKERVDWLILWHLTLVLTEVFCTQKIWAQRSEAG